MSLRSAEAGEPGALRPDPDGDHHRLVVSGDWSLEHYARLQRQIERHTEVRELDFRELGRLDTAGVVLLAQLLGVQRLVQLAETRPELKEEQRALLRTVGEALDAAATAPEKRRKFSCVALLARVGQEVQAGWESLVKLIGFLGLVLTVWARCLWPPRHWRLNAFSIQVQNAGLQAIPIVALLTFLVGAVVALLGATVLEIFGASIYTINLVSYAFMREFGVLLAAILMAGRTASAYTAQIGSMKINEELDAMRAQGFDPIEWLVLPRIFALVLTLPLLAFVGLVAGLLGGGLISVLTLDVPWERVVAIYKATPFRHFLVGMSKAPFFAVVIALIGCLEGFKVASSTESVGAHTTSSVVQCIFAVIFLDALAALFFMEVGW
ncbi:MAG: ABC transporter permease [Thermodesulfobacteriota bacterium]